MILHGIYSDVVWTTEGFVLVRVEFPDQRHVSATLMASGEVLWRVVTTTPLLWLRAASDPKGNILAVAQWHDDSDPAHYPNGVDRLAHITADGIVLTNAGCYGQTCCAVSWDGSAFVIFSQAGGESYTRNVYPSPEHWHHKIGFSTSQGWIDVVARPPVPSEDGKSEIQQDTLIYTDTDRLGDYGGLMLGFATTRGRVTVGQDWTAGADRIAGVVSPGLTRFLVADVLGQEPHLAVSADGSRYAACARLKGGEIGYWEMPPFPAWTAPAPDPIRLPVFAPFDHWCWVMGVEDPKAKYRLSYIGDPTPDDLTNRGFYVEAQHALSNDGWIAGFKHELAVGIARCLAKGWPLFVGYDGLGFPQWFIDLYLRIPGLIVVPTVAIYPGPGAKDVGEESVSRLRQQFPYVATWWPAYTQGGTWTVQDALDLQQWLNRLTNKYQLCAALLFIFDRANGADGIVAHPPLQDAYRLLLAAVRGAETWPLVAPAPTPVPPKPPVPPAPTPVPVPVPPVPPIDEDAMTPFRIRHRPGLLWTTDVNAHGRPTRLAAPLAKDGDGKFQVFYAQLVRTPNTPAGPLKFDAGATVELDLHGFPNNPLSVADATVNGQPTSSAIRRVTRYTVRRSADGTNWRLDTEPGLSLRPLAGSVGSPIQLEVTDASAADVVLEGLDGKELHEPF